MPLAMDSVGGAVTESAVTTFVAVTPGSGDTFAVRNINPGGSAYLEWICRNGTHIGKMRIRSPLLHDDVNGIRKDCVIGIDYHLGSQVAQQYLTANDVLILESTGTAADVDTLAYGIWYSDLAGIGADLHMPADLAGMVKNIVSWPTASVSGATIGNWGDVAINATVDLLHGNSSYAILGYTLDVGVTAVAIRGPDVGNMRCGGPGVVQPVLTETWFVDLSNYTGRPHIPVISANNKAGTYISTIALTASVASNVTLIAAELTQHI
jgi:hypothetical protein